MDDLISRRAVLDGLANIAKAKAKSDVQKSMMGRMMFFVEQLPSVKPQIDYLHCPCFEEDCIFDEETGDELDMSRCTAKKQPCEDAISRQAAIRLAEQGQIQGFEWQFKKLCTLPPVTTQQKVGRWIESNGVGMFVCSVCNESFYPMPTCMGKPLMKYCPNCGTKMEEGGRMI